MEQVIVKDFLGNEIKVGDTINIYGTKTPYMCYGVVIEMSEPTFFKNGTLDNIVIKIKNLAQSNRYRQELEDDNYKERLGRIPECDGFNYSNKCYMNILKVK